MVNASLADPFYQRLSNKVDVILFNPPYVPTLEEEALQAQDLRNIQGSWAGGSDGMQVTYAFLDRVEVCNLSHCRIDLYKNNRVFQSRCCLPEVAFTSLL